MSGDVLLQLPTTVKARTEEIVIRNQDPAAQRVDVYQSLRTMNGGHMGEPLKRFMRSVPVDAELAGTTIDGITGLQVITWLSVWAAGINAEDGAKAVAEITAPPVPPAAAQFPVPVVQAEPAPSADGQAAPKA